MAYVIAAALLWAGFWIGFYCGQESAFDLCDSLNRRFFDRLWKGGA